MSALPTADPFGCFVGAPVLVPGRPGRLTVAIKDNIDVAGLPTGAGLGRDGPRAENDAPLVRRLREAGYGLLGKTRMTELAFGASGENEHLGRTENPRCPGHSPGGSSSGSAAAVAADYCEAALGTDTLGSVRIPAAYCGLVGLKPTRGLLDMGGIVPLSWSLDHAGIIATSVAVTAEVLQVLTGSRPALDPVRPRIGVPDCLAAQVIEPETWQAFERALQRMSAAGWAVERCAVPGWNPVATRRAALLLVEAEAAAAHECLLAADDPALSSGTRAMLRFGRDCGTGPLVRALRVREEAAAGLQRALEQHDLLALPTVPAPAFAWAERPPDNQADLVALANLDGNPAISVPIGTAPDLRPLGLQLIGRKGADWPLLAAALRVEALYGVAPS